MEQREHAWMEAEASFDEFGGHSLGILDVAVLFGDGEDVERP